jgi:hypothetical protein
MGWSSIERKVRQQLQFSLDHYRRNVLITVLREPQGA